MPLTRRDKLITYLVVGPFAIVLAFPFYWMLQTSLKSERDLYNVENNPFSFGDGSPTLDNYRFLFEETQYLRVYVAQLRRKLEPDPAHPRYLITEPGMGYRFTLMLAD